MEAFSALLALCAENSPVTGKFPAQRPVTRSFDVFFDLSLNKRLSKHSWRRWFETPSRSLWRHCNAIHHSCPAIFMMATGCQTNARHASCYGNLMSPCRNVHFDLTLIFHMGPINERRFSLPETHFNTKYIRYIMSISVFRILYRILWNKNGSIAKLLFFASKSNFTICAFPYRDRHISGRLFNIFNK